MKIKLSPSILAADFANLEAEIKKVERAGAEYLHLDVMDGMFVPNISFGPGVIKALRPHSSAVFDVHLMINEPERYIGEFVRAGADIITVHYESAADPLKAIRMIKESGKRAGITIKPKTDPKVLDAFIGEVDMILIMTVEPGFGGQSFIEATLESIAYAERLIKSSGRAIELEVDGGITPDNVSLSTSAGANVIVAGSAIFKAADAAEAIAKFRHNAE